MPIIKENNEVWNINCMIGRENDVELEDDEPDTGKEEEENIVKLPAEESAEIFHEDDENMAVSECF